MYVFITVGVRLVFWQELEQCNVNKPISFNAYTNTNGKGIFLRLKLHSFSWCSVIVINQS